MERRLGISMVILAAVAVVAIGVTGFACGGKASSSGVASNVVVPAMGSCPHSGGCGMSGCPYMRSMQESGASGQLRMTCGGNHQMTYYGANVVDASNGRVRAVCHGKVFEITNDTPFVNRGEARYYLIDACAMRSFQADPEATALELDKEAVALATADGNVVSHENGQTYARCLHSGEVFAVTADCLVKVMDGKRYYFNNQVDLSTVNSPIHN